MKHGEVIRKFQRVVHGPEQELVNATTGEPVYRGSMMSVSRPVDIRNCDNCGEVEIEGIIALICADDACPQCNAPW